MNEAMIKMLLKAAGFEPENVKTQIQGIMTAVKENCDRQRRIEEKLDMLLNAKGLMPIHITNKEIYAIQEKA